MELPPMDSTFRLLTWQPAKASLPAHVAQLRFKVVPEASKELQGKWGGCEGCAGTESPTACRRLKEAAAPIDCMNGLIFKLDLEWH